MDNFEILYQKLSDQGRKRVDSYAKFILDEEEYADDLKSISGLINEFRRSTIWSSVELGNLEAREIHQIWTVANSYLMEMDDQNPYKVTLEKIIGHCNSFLQGEVERSSNIIAELKDLEHSIET